MLLTLTMVFSLATNVFYLIRDAGVQPSPDIKNIIVMIPDGMSTGGLALARWYKAYNAETETFDTSVSLALDELVSGHVRTWWQNGATTGGITDSAPAGTAMATGIKTNDKFVGVTYDSVPIATILEASQSIGKATGLVATSNIQHATPAGFSSHINNRALNSVIASQQVYNNIDVVFGGGSQFLEHKGNDLIEVLKERDYQYITTRDELLKLESGKVWGMFAPNAMAYDFDRAELAPDEPSIAEMTAKAIELLAQDEDGFFLMVEGSKIDWTAHANDPIGLISDILAFDEAVAVALKFAKERQDTMILALTDHGTGGVTIGNRDSQNSNASLPYDNAALDHFIVPLTKATLTGEGVAAKINSNRSNIREVMAEYYGIDDLTPREVAQIRIANLGRLADVIGLMLSDRSYIGWTTHGHTGCDVALFTYLPGNGRIFGTIENTDVAKIAAGVWGLDLAALTGEYYNDAEKAFASAGAAVEIDSDAGEMTVTKGSITIVIPEYRDYVLLNGEKVMLDSVIVNQSGKFYVPMAVLSMIQ